MIIDFHNFFCCVGKLLNFEQKQRRMDIAQEMLTTFKDDPDSLTKVITSDVSWVYGYGIEPKAQSSQWKRPKKPRPKKVRQVFSDEAYFDLGGYVNKQNCRILGHRKHPRIH